MCERKCLGYQKCSNPLALIISTPGPSISIFAIGLYSQGGGKRDSFGDSFWLLPPSESHFSFPTSKMGIIRGPPNPFFFLRSEEKIPFGNRCRQCGARGQEASFLDTPRPWSPQTHADLLIIAQVLDFKVIEVPLGDAKGRAGELGQAAQVL